MNAYKRTGHGSLSLMAAYLLTLLVLLTAGAAKAGEESDRVVIVLNARNPTQHLGVTDIKKLFLGQTAFWHGVVPVKVAVRPDSSEAAKQFFALIGITPQAFHKHWNELQLAGRGVSPRTFNSAGDLAKAIGRIPGGIGFALASETWSLESPAVKVVEVR